jgi:cyclophilin family peptidyl-prolyl cis-trans isomerase
MGDIVLELNREKAPLSVANFIKYAEDGAYDGTIFHRVMPTFMIQGGGFDKDVNKKSDVLKAPIKNESKNGLSNARGTIAMARTGAPHSATNQFFINVVDNAGSLDAGARGPWGYAVFGKVVEGMDVVDKIRNTECIIHPNYRQGGKVVPKTAVVITKAIVVTKAAVVPSETKKAEDDKKTDG